MDSKIAEIYARKRMWDHWSRLLAESERTAGGCLVWSGLKAYPGKRYGRVRLGGRMDLVHRHAWRLVHGPILNGLYVLHHCDNPPCWEPSHLFLGTALDNANDAKDKGRLWVNRT